MVAITSQKIEIGGDSLGMIQPLTLVVFSVLAFMFIVSLVGVGVYAMIFPSRGLVDRLVGTQLIYE